MSTLNSVDSQLHPGHRTSGSSSTTGPLVWGAQLGQLFFWVFLYVWKWYIYIYSIYTYVYIYNIYIYTYVYMDYIPHKWWFRGENKENCQDFEVPYWSSASGGLTGCFAEGPNVAASNAFREHAGLGTKLSRTHWRSMSSCASSVQTKAPIFKAWEPPYATYANVDWYLKWWSISTSYQRNVTSSGQLPDLVQSVKQQCVMIESDALCLVKPPRVLLVKRSVAGESWWNLCWILFLPWSNHDVSLSLLVKSHFVGLNMF